MAPADIAWIVLTAAIGMGALAVLYRGVRPAAASRHAAGAGSVGRFFGLYLLVAGSGHLAWEIMQLPFYGLWRTATVGELAFAVAHCTVGDLMIATAVVAAAGIVVRLAGGWPGGNGTLSGLAITFGIAYTAYSEWHNVYVTHAWAYAPQMPTIAISGYAIGLMPLAQWLAIPALTFYTLRPEPNETRR